MSSGGAAPARGAASPSIVVVGSDGEGELRRTLERRGVAVEAATLDRLGRVRAERTVLVGWAALERVEAARRQLGDAATIVAVLPKDAIGARLEALRHGARLVDDGDDLAAVVDALLEDGGGASLGWTTIGGLMQAAGERLRARVGARGGHVTLRLEEGAEAAAIIDRFAQDLLALATEARVEGSGPSVDDLCWEDDPQTAELPDEELERWRRIAARGAAPPRQSVVLGTLSKRTPVPGERRASGPWAPSDSEPPPAADHLPLVTAVEDAQAAARPTVIPPWRATADGLTKAPWLARDCDGDRDIEETAPRDAVPRDTAVELGPLVDDPDVTAPHARSEAARERPISGERVAVRVPPPPPGRSKDGGGFEGDPRPAAALPKTPSREREGEPVAAAETEQRETVPARPPRVEIAPRMAAVPAPAPSREERSGGLLPWIVLAIVLAAVVLVVGGVAVVAYGWTDETSDPLPLPLAGGGRGEGGRRPQALEAPRPAAASGAASGAVPGSGSASGSGSDPGSASVSASGSASGSGSDPGSASVSASGAGSGSGSASGAGSGSGSASGAGSRSVSASDSASASDSDSPADARARSDALVDEGLAHERAGNWPAARLAYERALAAHDRNPHAVAGLARERLTAGDADAALEHALEAVRLRRNRAAYRVILGDVYRMRGDANRARRAYERAAELDPDDPDARRRLHAPSP